MLNGTPKEEICTSLIELARELVVGNIELKSVWHGIRAIFGKSATFQALIM